VGHVLHQWKNAPPMLQTCPPKIQSRPIKGEFRHGHSGGRPPVTKMREAVCLEHGGDLSLLAPLLCENGDILSASGALSPDHSQGLCPWTLLGAPPPRPPVRFIGQVVRCIKCAVYCVQANKSRDLVEANIVVYSVTDRASFQYAQSCLQELRPAKRHNVVILVANKQDIVRNRVISEQGKSSSSVAFYTVFHKIGTPLFSFCNFSKRWSIMTLCSWRFFSHPLQCFYLLNYKIWGTLQDQNQGCPRATVYDNALWTNGISWISASSTKSFASGERDFELVRLQEEDNLNIRCDHFSFLTLPILWSTVLLNSAVFKAWNLRWEKSVTLIRCRENLYSQCWKWVWKT